MNDKLFGGYFEFKKTPRNTIRNASCVDSLIYETRSLITGHLGHRNLGVTVISVTVRERI